MGSVEKHRGAVDAKPICVWNAAFAGRQETLAVTPRKFPLCDTNSHTAVRTAALAALIRSAGLVAQYIVARELKVHFPFPGRSRKTHPVGLVHHRDDPTSTANRLVPGGVHLESIKRSRNVVLSDVVPEEFLAEVVERILRQPRRQIRRHVAMIVGVGTGLAALYQNAQASILAGHVGGSIPT